MRRGSDFLQLLNETNARIAEGLAQEQAEAEKNKKGVDPVRLQRDQDRREKLGQLRARPKSKRKTGHVRSVFGHVSLDP